MLRRPHLALLALVAALLAGVPTTAHAAGENPGASVVLRTYRLALVSDPSYAAAVALPSARRRTLTAWIVGLFCGLAVVTEFPAAVPVVIIVALALSLGHSDHRRGTLRLALHIAAAGAVMAVVLMAYHALAFGSPFQLG